MVVGDQAPNGQHSLFLTPSLLPYSCLYRETFAGIMREPEYHPWCGICPSAFSHLAGTKCSVNLNVESTMNG